MPEQCRAEKRIERLLDQLEKVDLTPGEIDAIERKIDLIRSDAEA